MNDERFKMVTRRCVFLLVVVLGTLLLAFLGVYGAMTGQVELVTLGAGALSVELGAVVAFLTTKKTSEE